MKKYLNILSLMTMLTLLGAIGCAPSVHLTASWHDPKEPPAQFSKMLVVAIGRDLRKRQMAETALRDELRKQGFAASCGIDEFGPVYGQDGDSARQMRALMDRGFDGVLTVRVVSVDEHDRWVPGTMYYGPMGYYHGFYGYYHHAWGFYSSPGYTVTDVKVLLESNCYRIETGTLLWTGQSEAFSRNPTKETASQYATNVVDDLLSNKIIQH